MRFEGKHNYFKDLAHRVKCVLRPFRRLWLIVPKSWYAIISIVAVMAVCSVKRIKQAQVHACAWIFSKVLKLYFSKNAAAVSIVNTLKYKERIVAEFPDITAESEVTRYVAYMYVYSMLCAQMHVSL